VLMLSRSICVPVATAWSLTAIIFPSGAHPDIRKHS
jgi:hypothetical protein